MVKSSAKTFPLFLTLYPSFRNYPRCIRSFAVLVLGRLETWAGTFIWWNSCYSNFFYWQDCIGKCWESSCGCQVDPLPTYQLFSKKKRKLILCTVFEVSQQHLVRTVAVRSVSACCLQTNLRSVLGNETWFLVSWEKIVLVTNLKSSDRTIA